jgi:hypothetical protein
MFNYLLWEPRRTLEIWGKLMSFHATDEEIVIKLEV